MKKIIFVLALVSALFVSCNKNDVSSLKGTYVYDRTELYLQDEVVGTYVDNNPEFDSFSFDGSDKVAVNGIVVQMFNYNGWMCMSENHGWGIKIISKKEIANGEFPPKERISTSKPDNSEAITTINGKTIFGKDGKFYYEDKGQYYHCLQYNNFYYDDKYEIYKIK